MPARRHDVARASRCGRSSTITGEQEFNEIFFTDVRVPVDALLGPVNEGWRVAMTTLAYERGGVANLHLGLRGEDPPAARRGRHGERRGRGRPVLRQRLARVYLEGELLKLVADRAISGAMHGRDARTRGRASPSWCGARPSSTSARSPATCSAPTPTPAPGAATASTSRALTIAGGTTQVNKNILAQRILGLPRK